MLELQNSQIDSLWTEPFKAKKHCSDLMISGSNFLPGLPFRGIAQRQRPHLWVLTDEYSSNRGFCSQPELQFILKSENRT